MRDTILVHLIVVGPITCALELDYYEVHPTNDKNVQWPSHWKAKGTCVLNAYLLHDLYIYIYIGGIYHIQTLSTQT